MDTGRIGSGNFVDFPFNKPESELVKFAKELEIITSNLDTSFLVRKENFELLDHIEMGLVRLSEFNVPLFLSASHSNQHSQNNQLLRDAEKLVEMWLSQIKMESNS